MTDETTNDKTNFDATVSVVGPGEGETIMLGAVMVPPGAPHTFANITGRPAVMLSTFTPDLYVQYFRDLQDMIADGRELTPQVNMAVMSHYATEPATGFA
ncbi:hypothetical protein [Nocardia sp. NPDC052112]|uniref:hypothetical protein n=1 Tax=Nocardia sp. NPDC052112 TaxID=3155646 RepID=UPI0034147452